MAETVEITKAEYSALKLGNERKGAKIQVSQKATAAALNRMEAMDTVNAELRARLAEANTTLLEEEPPPPIEWPPVEEPEEPEEPAPEPEPTGIGYWGLGQDAETSFMRLKSWCGHRPLNVTSWSQRKKSSGPNWKSWEWLQGGEDEKFESMSGCYSADGNPQLIQAMSQFGNDVERYVSITPCMLQIAGFDNADNRAQVWKRVIPGGDSFERWKRFAFCSGFRSALLCDRFKVPYRKLTRTIFWEATGSWYPWTAGPDHRSFTHAVNIWCEWYRKGARAHSVQAEAGLPLRFRYSGKLNFAKSQDDFMLWHPGKDAVQSTAVSFHPMGNKWTEGKNWEYEINGGPNSIGALRIMDKAKEMGHSSGCDEWTFQPYGQGKAASHDDAKSSIALALDFFAEHGGHGPGQIADQALMHTGHDKVVGLGSPAAVFYRDWVRGQMARRAV